MSDQANNERTYSAFISYRHTKPDMQVAIEVHRKLERFHLDRDVRERSGFKSLAPIFRDQDELPISSALDDDLIKALRNASALIVICSPRLKESLWCMREIDEFLKTHDRSRVFVVLCEGDPHDVIPERLLHRMDEDGNIVDVEPLAANFLPTCKGAERRNEVTRLAAGILDVPYDSLVKRTQRRRQRILAAIVGAAVAASTAFGFYNAYMNAQIKASYQQVLQRRSESLATEAHNLVREGNTIGATELALSALPDDSSDEALQRSVVSNAVFALQRATNAGSSESILNQYSFTTSEVYATPADIREMHTNSDERYVVTVDESEVVSSWEVANHRLIFQSRSSMGRYAEVVDAFILDSGNTVIVYKTGVVCRDGKDGAVLWDVPVGDAGDLVRYACIDEANQDLLMVASHRRAHFLDLTSGKLVLSTDYDAAEGFGSLDGLSTAVLCSPHAAHGRFAQLVSIVDGDGSFVGCKAVVVDMPDGASRAYEVPGTYAFDCDLLEDGSIVTLLGSDDSSQDVSNSGKLYGNTFTTTTGFDVTLCCLDPMMGKVRWANVITVWQECYDVGFKELREDEKPTGTLVCWLADRVQFVNSHTGDVVNELRCASALVGGNVLLTGQTFMGVETDGSFFYARPTDTAILAYGLMRDDLYYADVRPTGVMYVIKGNMLYVYRGTVYDESVHSLEVGEQRASWQFATHEGFVLAYIANDEPVLRVQHCSAPEMDVLWSQDLEADESLVWSLVGFDSEADQLLLAGVDVAGDSYVTRRLVRLDLALKQVKTWDLSTCAELGLAVPIEGSPASEVTGLVVGNATAYHDGVVYSQVSDAQGVVGIAVAMLDENVTRCHAVLEGYGREADRGQRRLILLADPTGRRLLYQDQAGGLEGDSGLEAHKTAVLDLATGASMQLDKDVAKIWHSDLAQGAFRGHVVWSADGTTLGCVSAEGVSLYGTDGRANVFIPLDGRQVTGMTLLEDRIVVMLSQGTTGQLESYDTKTGERLASCALDDGSDEADGWTLVPKTLAADGSGDLFVATSYYGYLINIDTLRVCQRFASGRAYNPVCDALLCADSSDTCYDAFSRYSLQALIDRGHNMLGSQTMGREWLEAHGV